MRRIQFYLTPAAGKALIGKAVAALPDVQKAVAEHMVVVVAGTTNAPVAYELLKSIGEQEGFCAKNFFRGITAPAGAKAKTEFIGDVVICKGKWLRGKTLYDVADEMGKGDIYFKGANAVNLQEGQAGVLLGNPAAGTVMPIFTAVYGKRAKLYVPVGVEKRVDAPISLLVDRINDGESEGLRMAPLPGEVVTEIEAIEILTGARAMLVGSGGVLGAEGGAYFLAEGTEEELAALKKVLEMVKDEPAFSL